MDIIEKYSVEFQGFEEVTSRVAASLAETPEVIEEVDLTFGSLEELASVKTEPV